MTDDATPDPTPEQPLQQIQHSSATARIPDQIGRGVFATAVIVLHGANEYTIDFVQSLARPNRVAARVILPPAVASQFVIALEQALEKYTASFGQPPVEPKAPQPAAQLAQAPEAAKAAAAGGEQASGGQTSGGQTGGGSAASGEPVPRPAAPQQPPIADIYDNLKLPDEMLGGVYANMASISHAASEFCFDFIAQFFPRSAVRGHGSGLHGRPSGPGTAGIAETLDRRLAGVTLPPPPCSNSRRQPHVMAHEPIPTRF